MRILSNNDLKSFEKIAMTETHSLMVTLRNILKKHYEKVVMTRDYIYAIGDCPIALVAHLDTVFADPPTEIFYDTRKGVIWSPQGLGADDRAGVFLILKLLAKGHRPTVIFTTGEEVGAIGAGNLVRIEKKPITELKYIIQLDRHGTSDCVFYSCYNPPFVKYIESFGFIEAYGSFTDISEICPVWGIAGVNLSVGYRNEHSIAEVLFVEPLLATLDKVDKMLSAADETTNWLYIPDVYSRYYSYGYKNYSKYSSYDAWGWDDDFEQTDHNAECICAGCGDVFTEYELFPVKASNGGTVFYCPDCICKPEFRIDWCEDCGEAYEAGDIFKHQCPDCKKAAEERKKSWNLSQKTSSLK